MCTTLPVSLLFYHTKYHACKTKRLAFFLFSFCLIYCIIISFFKFCLLPSISWVRSLHLTTGDNWKVKVSLLISECVREWRFISTPSNVSNEWGAWPLSGLGPSTFGKTARMSFCLLNISRYFIIKFVGHIQSSYKQIVRVTSLYRMTQKNGTFGKTNKHWRNNKKKILTEIEPLQLAF